MFPVVRFMVGTTHVVLSLHAIFVVLAVAVAALLVARRQPDALPVVLAGVLASLLGSRVLYCALHGGPRDLWAGGLSSTGGVVAAATAIWSMARLTRRPPLTLFDAVAPAGILALAVGRLGCFFAGCCYGSPTSLPWGVVFPDLGPPARHPVQLYSAAADAALALALPVGAPTGRATRAAAIGLGLVRAGLETLRDPAAADHIPGTTISLPLVAAVLLAAGGWSAAYLGRFLRARSPSTMAPPRRRS